MYDSVQEAMNVIESELDKFQWAYPDRSENRGELEVECESETLVLIVWVRDNEDPVDETVKPLHVSQPITTEDAQDQIRSIIHNYLTHEADEQMWFGEVRVFYPH